MSDPQDLLYTNQFISTNILSEEEITNEINYYDRFKKYVDNNTKSDTEKYIDDNLYESSDINIDKTLYKKWPIGNKKNHYPLFDSYINDISVNRYKKEILTKITIDSRNRDLTKYQTPNDFILDLPKVFNNIKKIEINDIIFPNVIQSVNNYSNNLAWQYASQNYLINNNIDNTIIPVPDELREISYSSLPNSIYAYSVTAGTSGNIPDLDNYLVYQTQISPGNYNIVTLTESIRRSTQNIIHGANLNTLNNNIVEQPYLAYPGRLGTPHLFSLNINPYSNLVQFVNRIEEVNISAIQTFSPYENNFEENDLFYYFSSQYSPTNAYILDTRLIYILVPAYNDVTYQYYLNVHCIYTPNAFPLVITDLKRSVGNINENLINYTEFYDINIYTQNGYSQDELDSISYYKFIDTITFSTSNTDNVNPSLNTSFVKKYLRFGLKLSLGNAQGNNYNSSGRFVRPSLSETLVYADSLKKVLQNFGDTIIPDTFNGTFFNSTNTTDPGTIDGVYKHTYTTSGIYADYVILDNPPLIGRALLFRWIFDKINGNYVQYETESINTKKRTLLHILAWPISNNTNTLYTLDINDGFKFVHTNAQAFIITKDNININNLVNKNIPPSLSLSLQNIGDQYFFITNSYVFIKINFNSSLSQQQNDQVLDAVAAQNLQYNQTYINENLFNVGIGEDYTCLFNSDFIPVLRIDPSNISAKLILSNIPGNIDTTLSNIINNNSSITYYNNNLNDIYSISVSVYDPNFRLLYLRNNFSFTLNIIEIRDILKETLVNSKTNNVVTTGHFI